MPVYTIDEMVVFVKEQTAADDVHPDREIGNDLGVDGDDFAELMAAYQKRFCVNLDGFRRYFHYAEEGSWNSLGGQFFKPPYERVRHIPITPKVLLDMANKGRWDLTYPEHSLPKRRYDVWFNQLVFILFTVYLFFRCAKD